jgi:cyclopropane-fatty-acyl-phospholipid synthase
MLKLLIYFYDRIKLNTDKKNDWRIRFIFKILNNIKYGQLKLVTPEKEVFYFVGSEDSDLVKANLVLNNWDALIVTFSKGDVGFGEAYMQTQWLSDNLTDLFQFISLNRNQLETVIHGKKLFLIYEWMSHRLNFNSKRNAKSNISAHYDLSNKFYKLFLDPTMTYSSAFYGANKSLSLEDAQNNKYQQVISLCNDLKKNFTVLEIGFGWGGFAKQILKETSAKYYGVTLSKSQHEFVNVALSNEIIKERCKFEILDYRNIVGKFDLIVSIEMFEAVGVAYWSKYFDSIKARLKPKGKALIQTILIRESKFEQYKKGVDFIQTYIFPGGMLASEAIFKNEVEKADLRILNELWFSQDYADTLKEWQILFEKNIKKIESLGLDKKFCNMWRFYLSYCEAGFKTGDIEVAQFTLEN